MRTLLQFEEWLADFQTRPVPDVEEFGLEAEARLHDLPVIDRPAAEALRQQVLQAIRGNATGSEPVTRWSEPPITPPAVATPPEAPTRTEDGKGQPKPTTYEDLLLVTTVLYCGGGRLVSRGEFVGTADIPQTRCRHYQLAVRRYTRPDGTAFMDLLRSNDPLVKPELWIWNSKVDSVRKLSPVSCIIDAPVRLSDDRVPYVLAGPSSQRTGSLVVDGRRPGFVNAAQSVLELFEESELFFPTLVKQIPDSMGRLTDGFDLKDARHGTVSHFEWDTQHVCYLEPEWPVNMPESVDGLLERLRCHASKKCGWLGFRYLAERNFEAATASAWNLSILSSVEGARSARQAGCKLHGSLLPLRWEDDHPLLNVDGIPENTRPDQWASQQGERLQVEESLADRWFQARASEAMGRLLRDSW